MSTSYHLQTNGQRDRANRTLEEMLRHFVNPTRNDSDEHWNGAEFACNNGWHEFKLSTPFLLNSSQQPYTSANMGLEEHSDVPLAKSFMTDMVQAVKDAKHDLQMAQQHQKKYYDLKRRGLTFKVRAQVLLNKTMYAGRGRQPLS